MENLPYNDPERLAQWFLDIFQVPGRENEVEAALKSTSQDICRIAKSIMNLLSSDSKEERIERAKAKAATFLQLVFARQYGDIAPNSMIVIIDHTLKTIMSPNTTLIIKSGLQRFLLMIFKVDRSGRILDETARLIEAEIQNMTTENCGGLFLAVEAYMLHSPECIKPQMALFLKVQEKLVQVTQELHDKVANKFNQEKVAENWNQHSSEISPLVETLGICVIKLVSVLIYLTKNNNNGIVTPEEHLGRILNLNTMKLFGDCLDLKLNADKQLKHCVISTTGLTGIDRTLNAIKTDILKCFNFVLMYQHKSGILQVKSPFSEFLIMSGAKMILDTLLAVCENELLFDLNAALTQQDFESFLIECLALASNLATIKEIYDFYFSYFKSLLNVCLVLLRTTPKELAMFKDNPEQFLELAIDVCGRQVSKAVKTHAAILLRAICSNMQGATTYFVVTVVNLMEYLFANNNPENASTNYPPINEGFAGIRFFKEADETDQLETCLLSLTIISRLVYKRHDLVLMITSFLEKFKEYFQDKDPLFRCRLYMLAGVYDTLISVELMEYILPALVYNPTYPVLSLVALTALEQTMENISSEHKLRPYIEEISLKIAALTRESPSHKIYNIIKNLFVDYTNQLTSNPELIKVLFEASVDKLVQIYTNQSSNSNEERKIQNNIWQIIKTISENNEYIPAYQHGIEQTMEPLFTMILHNESAPYGEDLLDYVASVTKLSKCMSPACSKMIGVFPKILLKTQGALGPLFPALNQAIVNGENALDPSFVKTLVGLGIQGLATEHESEIETIEFALLLQLIVQYLCVEDSDWERILIACSDKISDTENPKLKVKLGGVILSAFATNFDRTWKFVQSRNMESDILKLFLEECKHFDHAYDRKLLTIGLTTFLAHKLDSENGPRILDLIICFLKATTNSEKARKQNDAYYTYDFDDDEDNDKTERSNFRNHLTNLLSNRNPDKPFWETGDDEDEDEDEYDEDGNYVGSEGVTNTLESIIKTKDEFVVFKQVITRVDQGDKNILREAIGKLEVEKKLYLKEILRTKRIVVDTSDGKVKTMPRVILKAKGAKIL